MNATFDLKGFLGYIRFQQDKDTLRPQVDHQLYFRTPDEATIIVPTDELPVGLLYWDQTTQRFWIETIKPKQGRFR